MEKNQKINKIRTKLLIQVSSEIPRFIKSPILINSVSSNKIYEKYSNIEIKIQNPYEFSTVSSKEIQNKFLNIISPKSETLLEFPIKEKYRRISKMMISEKKNQTFFDKLELNEINKNSQDTSDTTISGNYDKRNIEIIKENDNEEIINNSIKFLRKKANTFINRIKRVKKKPNSFYQNIQFKSQANLRIVHRKNESFNPLIANTVKIFEETIIQNSPILYTSGNENINSGISFFNNDSSKTPRNISGNKNSKISYNFSFFNHKRDNTFLEQINPFVSTTNVIKVNPNKNS